MLVNGWKPVLKRFRCVNFDGFFSSLGLPSV